MARSRSNIPILEQSRHQWRRIALIAAVVLVAGGGGLLLRPESRRDASPNVGVRPPHGRGPVEVLNGPHRQGAARTAPPMLRGKGLDVVFPGNADSPAESTRVIVRRGDQQRARYVAAALGAGKMVVQIDTFRRVDVSVILGDDFRPTLPLHP